jgi:hypothetical protein
VRAKRPTHLRVLTCATRCGGHADELMRREAE